MADTPSTTATDSTTIASTAETPQPQPQAQSATTPAVDAKEPEMITIIGFGSLLSKRSCLSSFASVKNFRLARVRGYRRVFAHVASIFFQRGIANFETKEMSSMSAEPLTASDMELMVTVFEIDSSERQLFYEREEEFIIKSVPFVEVADSSKTGEGLMCLMSSDEHYLSVKGQAEFDRLYGAYGLNTIWGWPDIRPCRLYLRHCVLAARSHGPELESNFLDTTFLVDRTTTIRKYLEEHPDIMEEKPPAAFADRYNG